MQYIYDVSSGSYCARYNYTCTDADTSCQGLVAGTIQTAYTYLPIETINLMRAYPSSYMDLIACDTDYCNSPTASASSFSSTGYNAPIATAYPTYTGYGYYYPAGSAYPTVTSGGYYGYYPPAVTGYAFPTNYGIYPPVGTVSPNPGSYGYYQPLVTAYPGYTGYGYYGTAYPTNTAYYGYYGPADMANPTSIAYAYGAPAIGAPVPSPLVNPTTINPSLPSVTQDISAIPSAVPSLSNTGQAGLAGATSGPGGNSNGNSSSPLPLIAGAAAGGLVVIGLVSFGIYKLVNKNRGAQVSPLTAHPAAKPSSERAALDPGHEERNTDGKGLSGLYSNY